MYLELNEFFDHMKSCLQVKHIHNTGDRQLTENPENDEILLGDF